MNQVTGTTGADAYDFDGAEPSEAVSAGGPGFRAGLHSLGAKAFGVAKHLVGAFAIAVMALGPVMEANRRYAPERYQPDTIARVADAFEVGASYAIFDLNIDFRKLREEQIKRLSRKPELVVLGGGQWREAGANLVPDRGYLNLHVPLDYYDDALGMVELLVRQDKLPKDLVITLRDGFFMPAAARSDSGWLSGFANYQAMGARLSLAPLSLWERYPLQSSGELMSPVMLYANALRWHTANERPGPTFRKRYAALDVLLPDGSISWSDEHLALMTRERAKRLAIANADAQRTNPPAIDPRGVEALDRLLSYLGVRNVAVHLALPPFNPIFFDRIQDSPYMEELGQVEAVTRELAEKHKLAIVGSFDPNKVGCTTDMFIDAENASAACIGKVLADVVSGEAPAHVTSVGRWQSAEIDRPGTERSGAVSIRQR